KILRLDVDKEAPYIPETNPFIESGRGEIWAYGFRNPWRTSFDKLTGDFYIADVGQMEYEEINKISAPLTPGLNFGWRCYEANNIYVPEACVSGTDYVAPIASYSHSQGCAVIGGYVYRGSQIEWLYGKYVFADYCQSRLSYIDDDGQVVHTATLPGNLHFTAFGQDLQGELYVSSGNTIFHIVDPELGTSDLTRTALQVYPNPAADFFTVKSGEQIDYIQI